MARSPVTYAQLVALLGKQPDDAAVAKLLAKTTHTVKSDFIIGKDAGFDFSLDRPDGAKKKVLSALFLHAPGPKQKPYTGDLPGGAVFGPRETLLAALGTPHTTWKIGKGKVPVTTPDVAHDTWLVDGRDLTASYRRADTSVGHFLVKPAASVTGRDLSTHPLHFETKPIDAPPQAELVGMALLVAWGATRHGLSPKHAGSAAGKQLLARESTPRAFLVQACSKTLSTLDFVPELHEFLYEYLHHVRDDEGARDKANQKIAKLLGIEDPDRRAYTDDFVATFAGVLESAFHVPDSWTAVDRLAPVLDARLADFTATGFLKAPDVKLYEKAVALRDKQKVVAERATAVATGTADDTLADALVGVIGRSLKQPEVKAVITRAGMPIGKKIDQQANLALGVAYMGTNMQIDGKKQLGVDCVYFFAAKQKSYIRGIGAEVEFAAYPARLPRGLALGDARAAVAKTLGAPESTYENNDYWTTAEGYRLRCEFAKGKLVQLSIGVKRNY